MAARAATPLRAPMNNRPQRAPGRPGRDMQLLLVINRAPYDGTDVAWNALRLADTALEGGLSRRRWRPGGRQPAATAPEPRPPRRLGGPQSMALLRPLIPVGYDGGARSPT